MGRSTHRTRLTTDALAVALALALAASLGPTTARAQTAPTDPLPASGPIPMLAEPASIVDVVDAFDVAAAWSFRLTAGYQYESHTATIQRENGAVADGGLGVPGLNRIGSYHETTHTLLANAELGLYHDLALTFGVPVILSNTREIRQLGDQGASEGNAALGDGWSENGHATSLFTIPSGGVWRAPERSGIDQLRLGIAWAILNQQRDRTKPTWLVRFEWRPPVGSVMHACQATDAGSQVCPAASSVPSIPAGGSTNATMPAVRPGSSDGPGISRGVHGIYFQTALARRMGYIEPYAGMDVLAEFPLRSTPFNYFDTPYGQLLSFPPIQASLTVGAEIIPWENRETWQRAVIDLRIHGTYVSQGRDYSPLYDALGSSNSRALLQPGCPSNVRNADGSCQPGRDVYFDGLTAVASHAILGGNLTVSIQPSRFLRFNLGAGLSFATSHVITNTDACSQNTTVPASNPEWQGGCVGNRAPDPLHRAVIDSPGQRFVTTDEMYFDLYASIALTPRF